MAVQCPYCMHLMGLKGAKPGRFTPRCPACKERFLLVIPDDEAPPVASVIHASPRRERVSDAVTEALELEKTPVPQLKPRPLGKPDVSASTSAETLAPTVSARATSATVAPSAPSAGKGRGKSASGEASSINETTPPPASTPSHAATARPAPAPQPLRSTGTVVKEDPNAIDVGGASAAPPAENDDNAADADGEPDLSGIVGGYEIVKRLGRGGMGSVYLARQTSLDRNVALKTLLNGLAADSQFVARFTREAYAAAQLTHHNVVQIYDIGEQARTHFFSMEFVEGKTLAQLVREQGRIDPEVAVGYILQAARGLKFAHDHGMVHRDIKPDNLLLNRHGIVKVADLGLVKVVDGKTEDDAQAAKRAAATGKWYDTEKTQLNISMGTPAYMPPEQAMDAAKVDHRADIYSLGCTLYALLVGRPPFQGHTAIEVITKHQNEPVTPPDRIVEYVPKDLSGILLKMMAKRPEDRYQDMGEVIGALEGFLGVQSAGPFSPREEQAKSIENCAEWFNNVALGLVRRKVIWAFFPACAFLIFLSIILPSTLGAKIAWAGGFVGFTVLTPLIYLLIQGITQRTHLLLKVREFVFGARLSDWAYALCGAFLFFGLLYVLDLHLPWLGFAVAAGAVAAAFHFSVDRAIAQKRSEPVLRAEGILKGIRAGGVSEPQIQQFVCKYSGEHWEEFFEAMFGYEAKIAARDAWGKGLALGRTIIGDRGRDRPKYAAWRDPVIRWIAQRQKARKEERDRRFLEKLERASLQAKGVPEKAARKKAQRVAESIVVKAAALREEAGKTVLMDVTSIAPAEKTGKSGKGADRSERGRRQLDVTAKSASESRIETRRGILEADEDEGLDDDARYKREGYFKRRYGGFWGFLLGPSTRFLLGVVMLAGCILWVRQNNLVNKQVLLQAAREAASQDVETVFEDAQSFKAAGKTVQGSVDTKAKTKALDLPGIPPVVTAFFDSWWIGGAGLLLVLSAFFGSIKLGLFVVPGALVVLAGRVFMPPIGPMAPELAASVVGTGIIVAGYVLMRK